MAATQHPRGAVVVTGASTGIGRACALHLAGLGFQVHATVRRDADADQLRRAAPGLEPLLMDVCDDTSVAAAARCVSAAGSGLPLRGLVNNAGICVVGPLEFLPMEQFREQLDVNLLGALRCIRAFLPALRAAGGRIVNVSSISGRVCFPLLGAYNVSKFGLEALSDVLRLELREQGVRVAVIEPGAVQTPIWKRSAERAQGIARGLPEEAWRLYGALTEKVQRATERAAQYSADPRLVVEAVTHALTAAKPKIRYPVGKDARRVTWAARLLSSAAMDRKILANMK